MFIDQIEEIFTDICGNIFAKWWIEPYNISFPRTSSSDFTTLNWLNICKLVLVTAFVKCIFVIVCYFFEYFIVRRWLLRLR